MADDIASKYGQQQPDAAGVTPDQVVEAQAASNVAQRAVLEGENLSANGVEAGPQDVQTSDLGEIPPSDTLAAKYGEHRIGADMQHEQEQDPEAEQEPEPEQ